MNKKDLEGGIEVSLGSVGVIPINTEEDSRWKQPDESLPQNIPILSLRNLVILPGAIYPIVIGRKKSLTLLEELPENQDFIGAVPQVDVRINDPKAKDLYSHGTILKILRTIDMMDGTKTIIVKGILRFKISSILTETPFIRANVEYEHDQDCDKNQEDLKLISDSIKQSAIRLLSLDTNNRDLIKNVEQIEDFELLINTLITTIHVDDFKDKLALLSESSIFSRAMNFLKLLRKQEAYMQLKMEIDQKVKTVLDKQQREYYLQTQLKCIQDELGVSEDDVNSLKNLAKDKKWSDQTKAFFEKELAKLERYNTTSPDYSIQYSYLKFFVELPWNEMTEDNLDLKHAQKVLDEDHFGLEKVKDRIIEYLSVLKLKGNMKSPILCLYGPPGVGKTSLGKSIARALGRKYVRIALGGMHDEAEIRGHRKTYIGALPGRIIAGINKAASSNPVIVLDEIDKLSSDIKGDPSSALLEVLDPEQNTGFHDNYLDCDYDLSNVLFITTANTTSTIQSALLDRMELIDVSGYLAEEKVEIAKKFLLPKQLEEHGLPKNSIKLSKSVLLDIIENYTRESGVRSLDKALAKISRLQAKKIAMEEEIDANIEKSSLKEYLGLPIASHDKQEGNEAPGVVTGLAWTSVGGEVLFIESSISQGSGKLSMTGNLGQVMKESLELAYRYLKAHPELVSMSSDEFAKKDVHIHVPEGATPKDGPSAGVTILSSMVSAFRNKKIRPKTAMTGEITLRGRVLPVGGIKEKILAAKRAGVNTIVISSENRKNVEDIKEIYLKGLKFVYVDNVTELIDYIFSY